MGGAQVKASSPGDFIILKDVGCKRGSAMVVNCSGCRGVLMFPDASFTCPCTCDTQSMNAGTNNMYLGSLNICMNTETLEGLYAVFDMFY